VNAEFTFIFVESASEGRSIVVGYAGYKAIVDVIGGHRNGIATAREVKKHIVGQSKDADGDCGKRMRNMGMTRHQSIGGETVIEPL